MVLFCEIGEFREKAKTDKKSEKKKKKVLMLGFYAWMCVVSVHQAKREEVW